MMKYSKKIVIAAICAIIAIWIAETILIAVDGIGYSEVFIKCWFTFWAVELSALAGIKVSETVTHKSDADMPKEPFDFDDDANTNNDDSNNGIVG